MSNDSSTNRPQTLEEKRALLARHLAERSQQADCYPLSYAQRRLWLLQQINADSYAYNMSTAVRLAGAIEIPLLEQSVNLLADRHESLRTRLKYQDGQPVQEVTPELETAISVVEIFAHQGAGSPETTLENLIKQEAQRPFDLENEPLFRLFLFRLSPHEHVFLLTMHHLISDGWSLGLFFKELGQIYNALLDGRQPLLSPLPMQYGDFVNWQTRQFDDRQLLPQFEYWSKQLKNCPSLLQLPTDRPRPHVQTFAGTRSPLTISGSVPQKIRKLSEQQGLTLFMTLLAAFNVLLFRYTAQEDIVVGSPIAGRNRKEAESLIGFFVNTLALRTDLSGNPSFIELMQRVRKVALGAYRNQDLPFEKLVEEVLESRDLSHNPLFQTAFALQNIPAPILLITDVGSSPIQVQWHTSKVDLSVMLQETDRGLEGFIEYNTDLFDQATIDAFGGHFAELLNSIVSNPECPVATLNILPQREKDKLVFDWNNTARDFPGDICLHQMFELQVELCAGEDAVIFQQHHLSYAELNHRSNKLARYLQSLGVGPGVLVALSMERSLELIIAIFGIMKAGGAYVPLDPGYPPDRLLFMLDDSQAKILLTQGSLLHGIPGHQAQLVCLDSEWQAIEQLDDSNLDVELSLDDLAYVIYTSGSTGRPKAVMVSHTGISNLSHEQTRLFKVGPDSRVLQFSSISFDASVFEIVMALTHGAVLCMGDKDSIAIGPNLIEFLVEHRISIVTLPPSALLNMPADALPALRTITVAGEACPESLVEKWSQGRQFFNLYGPTEATIWSTYEECLDTSRPPTIGRPISNVRAYVLDEYLQAVPAGVAGQLHIGGKSISKGYLNRPEMTREKFIPDPFSDNSGDLVYRTGDLVRFRKDGNIEFLGRIDHQVKIRGYRVELGEIEAVLNKHPDVLENAVIVRDQDGDKRLVAYVVLSTDTSWDELKAYLRAHLLEHMVPAIFVKMERLPLNQSGKVARNELPAPTGERQLAEEFVAPADRVETELSEIWKALLQLDSVGIRDNFFDIGGHSLLVVQMHAKIRQKFDTPISIVELFQYPTIETLAKKIRLSSQESGEAITRPAVAQSEPGLTYGAEPIAIIGMSGRYPDAGNTGELWNNLKQGKESLREFSDAELRASGVDEDLLRDPDYVRAGIVLDDIDMFDASFFGFTPREAQITDPQQRVFMECAWEAMEAGGYASSKCDSVVGVFSGVSQNKYLWGLMDDAEVQDATSEYQLHLVNDKDFLPTRISYKLNLKGPSVNIQTACSTSLVSIHMACQSLQRNECDMALAGGVSIGVPQKVGYLYQPDNIRSPDGHCRAFDAKAQGCVRGHGASIVLLKRLQDAQADGDTIYAVIRGSAINNDGSNKIGYTAPSVEGQAEVVRRAQKIAGIDADSITYIETHGTGTALGDPIEIAGLTSAFRTTTDNRQFCAIGSVKTNLGHLDAAAGATSLIKASLALKHRMLPPSLNFDTANPEIDFSNSPFYVNTELRPWQSANDSPLRAGVSSFGIGGTNVHAVLEEAPARNSSGPSRDWQLILLSAKTDSACKTMSSRLSRVFRENPDTRLADTAYTLMLGREDFRYRRALLCRDTADLIELLEGENPAKSWTGCPVSEEPGVVFMFTGQGSQYPGMGAELYHSEPVFREQVDICCEYLSSQMELDLRTIIFPADDQHDWANVQLNNTQYTQVALFVIEYALARLWMSWGITPAAMIGHSIGEYVAAHLAGVFTLEDALALVVKRGLLMSQLPSGSMLAVPLSPAELGKMLGQNLSIATINGPELCVVAGPEAAVDALAAKLEARDLAVRHLHTSHAFHSSMMDAVVAPFVDVVNGIDMHSPSIPYLSNVTGTWITDADVQAPSYWGEHLRNTVRFSEGVEQLFADASRIYLEIGPGRTLGTLVKNHPGKPADIRICASIPAVQEKLAGDAFILENLAKLWVAGMRPDWQEFYADEQRYRIPLPTYPFERRRYWAGPTGLLKTAIQARVSKLENWFYLPAWKRSMLTSTWRSHAADMPEENWLVFEDSGGLGDRLVAVLRHHGQRVTTVSTGDSFTRVNSVRFVIRPDQQSDYRRLLDALDAPDNSVQKVIHLWSLNTLSGPDTNVDPVDEQLMLGFFSPLYLIQAMQDYDEHGPWGLTMVTSQSQAIIDAEALSPGNATGMGICRALSLEKPYVTSRCIDLKYEDLQRGDLPIELSILDEVAAASDELLVALRGSQRWIQSFEPLPLSSPASMPRGLRQGGVYLITGGLGRLGLTLAEYLARTTQARLVLVGRSPLAQEADWQSLLDDTETGAEIRWKISRLKALRDLGLEFMICAADVSKEQQMRQVFDQAETRFGEINGVLHAAGGIKQGEYLHEATFGACQQQFAPKIRGLQVLDKILSERNADFCLLCSSLASILGVSGFVSYISSHLFMDAYANARNLEGKTRWLSVNWDNWNLKGDLSQVAPGLAKFVMSPEEGCDALGRMLDVEGLTQVVVSTGDLESRIRQGSTRDKTAPQEVINVAPGPADSEASATDRSAAPANAAEKILLEIWAKLLGIATIGVLDNFFELGGDSVLNIQITARARKAGLFIKPGDVFEHQTIRELALISDQHKILESEQGLVTGAIQPTPIMQWFLEQKMVNPNHFNQARMLAVSQPLNIKLLNQAINTLLNHHDVLRLRYVGSDQGFFINGIDEVSIARFDLSDYEPAEQDKEMDRAATRLQSSLDIVNGPILKIAYFDLGKERAHRLCIVIHHLAIDAVSWRLLLEDLESAYRQLDEGHTVSLPEKSTSIRAWAEALQAYARSGWVENQLGYWAALSRKLTTTLPLDYQRGDNLAGSTDRVTVVMDLENTRSLLQQTSGTATNRVMGLLLTALVKSVCRWTGETALFVDLEGHGRDLPLGDGIDISRTMGWFTTLYPACLELNPDLNAHMAVQAIEEQYREIPAAGSGYGILKYLSGSEDVKAKLDKVRAPDIMFLYFGRVDDSSNADGSLFLSAPELAGPVRDPLNERQHKLEINVGIVTGCLEMNWTFSLNLHRRETIETIAQNCLEELSVLVSGDGASLLTGISSEDFSATSLKQTDLNKILQRL